MEWKMVLEAGQGFARNSTNQKEITFQDDMMSLNDLQRNLIMKLW